jgi:hypothetical protein
MGAQSSFGFHLTATVETARPEVALEPGEELVVEGSVWAGWGRRRPLGQLVVTDRRLLLHTQRLFGRDRVVEVAADAVVAVSPPDAGDVVDVRYVAPGGGLATVHLAPVRWRASELYRALARLAAAGR